MIIVETSLIHDIIDNDELWIMGRTRNTVEIQNDRVVPLSAQMCIDPVLIPMDKQTKEMLGKGFKICRGFESTGIVNTST